MDANLLNISKVESFFDALLKNKLSKNIFYSSLPTVMKESWSEMVLVDIANIEHNGVGQGYVNVFIYVRSRGDGRKNVMAFNKLSEKFNSILDEYKSEHYFIDKQRTYADYDISRKLDCEIVQLRITII